MFITIIIFLLILSVLVLAHEFGHFFTARRCGVKAEEFGLGFPPRAVGWYRDQKKRWHCLWGDKNPEGLAEDIRPADTIYSFNWLPIGGFVKIKGENGDGAEETDSFASKKVGRRALILSAGVIMNIILAFVLFSACYMIGAPQSVDSGGRIEVTELVKDSPAKTAGILSGDVITGADDQTFGTIPQLQDYIGAHGNDIAR
jgi:regulator of sigma E protease